VQPRQLRIVCSLGQHLKTKHGRKKQNKRYTTQHDTGDHEHRQRYGSVER